jgi:hypothetical protein
MISSEPHLKERYSLGGLGMVGRIILKCILQKYDGRAWTGYIWLRKRTRGGFL